MCSQQVIPGPLFSLARCAVAVDAHAQTNQPRGRETVLGEGWREIQVRAPVCVQTRAASAELISSQHLNTFTMCRISKGRVHAMACLGQGHPRETLDDFFMVLFFSLDTASPAHRKFSTLCSCNTLLVLLCATE